MQPQVLELETTMHTRLLILTVMIAFVSTSSLQADDKKDVKVGAITLKAPATWKQSKPTSRLRLAQFEIPAVEGDKEPAELAIFSFGAGGGVSANVKRWVDQFYAAERKAKTTAGKSAAGQYVFVDVSGTFKKPVGPPVLRKTEPMKDARMLAVILAVEGEGNYFLKLVGHNKTVTKSAEAFRASFGAKEKDEKPFEEE